MHNWILVCLLACVQDTAIQDVRPAGPTGKDEPAKRGPYQKEVLPPAPPIRRQDWEVHPPAERTLGEFLYREGVVHELKLTLTPEAVDSLRYAPDEDVVGQLTVDQYPPTWPIAVRLKGTSSYRNIDLKPAFKIDFHEWDPEARFYGIKRLTLNNMAQDATMMREHLYYWMCGQLGLPAARHTYARVWLNDEDYGLYGVLENMDEQFINRVWPDDDGGPFYEGSSNDFTDARRDFELEEVGVGLVLDDLITTVESTPPDAYLTMLETHFDLDVLLRYWALDIVTGNPDGYVLNLNNFYLYGAPIAGKWTMVPSGVDRAFEGTPREIAGALALGCRANDACSELLDTEIDAMVAAWDTLGVLSFATEMAAVVGPLCEADPKRDKDCRTSEILPYIEARAGSF